jgi:uncharacterized protein YycO
MAGLTLSANNKGNLNPIMFVALASTGSTSDGSISTALVGSEWSGDGNNLDLSKLQVGNIILVSGVIVGDRLLPGHYSHAAMYIGNGEMIEAWKDGVRKAPISMIHKASDAAIYRVKIDNSI